METHYQTGWVAERASDLVEKSQFELHRSADRMFNYLALLQWFAAIAVATLITPRTWLADTSFLDFQLPLAILAGGLLTLIPLLMTRLRPASTMTRHVIAVCQMGWSILFIHLTGGRIETHFHIFGSLALLSIYRDWRVLVTASLVVALDHLIRGLWWPMSVFGVPNSTSLRWIEHAAWIAFADCFLLLACRRGNRLANQLCLRQAELEQTNRDVEKIIWARTKDLKEANRKLKCEVKTRVRAETEREKLTRKLLLASRQAGMSEIATGVLHSVGNVINSINVSTDTILDRLANCRIDRLREAVQMINQDPAELATFLTENEKGRQLNQYLLMATDKLHDQHQSIHEEIVSMRNNVAHVVEIVSMQQTYASVGGVTEEFSIQDVLEDAININIADGLQPEIEIVRNCGDLPLIWSERHKVLQILVNLISNAKHSVMHSARQPRRIEVSTAINESNMISVSVKDSGVGISSENLSRIFQHGFTTRKNGHGFGLHSSVLTAHELNGNLECTSDGRGCGAEFVLTLPVTEVPVNSVHAAKFFIPSFNSSLADATYTES